MNSTATIAHLESRAILRLRGPDRFTFLQGLTSNDLEITLSGKPVFTAFLTPQGKYLFDFIVVPGEDETLLIDCEIERIDALIHNLQRFRLRADIVLQDSEDDYRVYACWDGASGHAKAFTDPRLAALGERLILPTAEAVPVSATESDYRMHRYRHGVPEGGHEIPSSATLLEINFDVLNGISFVKGCYMGQELTARMHHRGLVKKRYLPFSFEGKQPLPHDRIIYPEHKGYEIGEVYAVEGDVGLGLFNIEHVMPYLGEPLIYDGTTYIVNAPDYLRAKLGIKT